MEKLKPIIGRGSIATTTGQITAVVGVGSVENIQAINGTGSIARTAGSGGVNQK